MFNSNDYNRNRCDDAVIRESFLETGSVMQNIPTLWILDQVQNDDAGASRPVCLVDSRFRGE